MVSGRSAGGRPVMSRPSARMRPVSGRSNPAISDNSVLFPAPLGPMTARNSPVATDSEKRMVIAS